MRTWSFDGVRIYVDDTPVVDTVDFELWSGKHEDLDGQEVAEFLVEAANAWEERIAAVSRTLPEIVEDVRATLGLSGNISVKSNLTGEVERLWESEESEKVSEKRPDSVDEFLREIHR